LKEVVMKANIGLIGLSVMGVNLALNIADNNYKLVVEKISEANVLPFGLDDLRFVVGKKIEDKWIYKDVFVVPFEYSLHHGIEYKLTWIDGGVIIKTIAEKQYHSKVYRIYFEDMF